MPSIISTLSDESKALLTEALGHLQDALSELGQPIGDDHA